MNLVHLNNAGAALMPRAAHDAILRYLALEQELGAYEAADTRLGGNPTLLRCHGPTARSEGSQHGPDAELHGGVRPGDQRLRSRPGDVILTSRSDYASNQIMYLSLARRRGVEIVRAPDAPEGGIDPDAVRKLVAHRPTHPRGPDLDPHQLRSGAAGRGGGPNLSGSWVPYLIDGCQAVGQIPIGWSSSIATISQGRLENFCAVLAAWASCTCPTRRSRNGAYPLLVDMHGRDWTDTDTFELESGRPALRDLGVCLCAGDGSGCRGRVRAERWGRHWLAAAPGSWRHMPAMRLADIPGVRVLDRGPELCAIVTIAIAGRDTTDIKLALRARGINTSSPQREDAVIDMDEKGDRFRSPNLTALLQHEPRDRYCGWSPRGDLSASSLSTFSRTRHTVSAILRCPSAVGCIPSA